MLRRAASLMVAAFMLDLNAVGIERACASPPAAQTHEHGHSQHQSQSRSPSDAPVCCDALGACAMSFELPSAQDADALAPDAESRELKAERRPRTLSPAPDPPPPKA